MFKLCASPTFAAKAGITIPGEDKLAEISIVWRHKTRDQINDWIKRSATANDIDTLSEVIEGWSGVVDTQGTVVPYSRAALAELLQTFPAAGMDLFRAYLRELSASRAKN